MKTATSAVVLILALLATYSIVKSFTPVSDYITAWVARTGQLQIGNAVPSVDFIYLNITTCTDTPSDAAFDLTENTTKVIKFKARINDTNGDCNTFASNNGTLYLCSGDVATCNSSVANYTFYMNYSSADGQWGTGNRYCNMSTNVTGATAETLPFYELNGTWTVNITITDGIDSNYLIKKWTVNELRAWAYPPSGSTVDLGSNLNAVSWNNGTGGQLFQNSGNIVLDLQWNASDFSGPETIAINGTNFIVDDDSSGTDDTGNIAQVNINDNPLTQVYFDPDSGLLRCSNTACGNANATMSIYWHIYIGSVQAGTYTDSITIENEDHPGG